MKKIHKIIIPLGFVLIICLIIFLSKDFVIRQHFIKKLENHDFDEYILNFSINDKKTSISYYTQNFVAERNYDKNGNLCDEIDIYEYTTNLQHKYNSKTAELFTQTGNYDCIRPMNINNKILLNSLKEYTQNKFTYKHTGNINNRECYILEFEDYNNIITTIYLDKELLYTLRIDTYMPVIEENLEYSTVNNHIIWDYTIDLDLKQKDLFDFNIKK